MDTISHNSGLTPVPLSNNVLNNTPSRILAQVNSFTNYEAVLKDLSSNNTSAPTFILAMGDGSSNIPKQSSYEFDFYSASILGRTGYNNAWINNYQKSEKYTISYFDGITVFKRFSIENESGKLLGRSIELRNGNIPFTSSNTQLIFGWASDSKINETSTLRHSIKTVHSQTIASENAIDLYLWNPVNDQPSSIGSRHVARFNGIGNFEIIKGSEVMGGVAQALSSTPSNEELTAEQTALAITGKGVLYYNSVLGRFRYSENGSQFYFFGNGAGSAVVNLPANQIAIGNGPTGLVSSSALTFTGGNLITTGNVTGANFITSGNVSSNTLTVASNSTIGGNVTITSLPTGLVKSVNGLLTSVSGISEIPGISIGVNQIAYGTGTGITGSNSFTYVQGSGISALTVGDNSGNVGRVIFNNGLSSTSEHNFGIMWATSANPMFKFDQGLAGSWEAITFYSAESPKKIYFNANGEFNGTLKVSSLGIGTSLVKSVAGVLTNASPSDVLSAISINVANTQVAVGNGTGLVGSSGLTYNSGTLAVSGAVTVGSTLTVTGLSGLVKATAGVLGNATFADIPGITISPNQVAYGKTSSGITGSSNFTFDGNQAILHNTLTTSSAFTIKGGTCSANIPGGVSYGIGVHLSSDSSYGTTLELTNNTSNWVVSNKTDDIFRISRNSTDYLTHNAIVCNIIGNTKTNNLYLGKTYAYVATEGDYYILGNSSGYWVIPTGLTSLKIKLPTSPIEGTTFCIYHVAKNGTTVVSAISGNGKQIVKYGGPTAEIVTNLPNFLATIVVYDLSTDAWYAHCAFGAAS